MASDGLRPVIDLVAGARPNFVKLAPLHAALEATGRITSRIIHTGQHYDARLSEAFFTELGIPEPAVHLDVGSASHGVQTARILERYEAELIAHRPDAVVVFGDVNSTLAAGLAAAKLHIPVAHVEAGLRSGDRRMPEEINRVLTDALSSRYYVTEATGRAHLVREGVPPERIVLAGNIMIDSLLQHRDAIDATRRATALGLTEPYGLITLHRPANVDHADRLEGWLDLFRDLARRAPMVFPVHPRTRAAAQAAGLTQLDAPQAGWHAIGPEPYLDHLSLLAGAAVVVTDSGGMQVECASLGVPCVVLRDTTEHVSTVEAGACRLAGSDHALVSTYVTEALAGDWPEISALPLADGHAAERIAADLATWLTRDRARD